LLLKGKTLRLDLAKCSRIISIMLEYDVGWKNKPFKMYMDDIASKDYTAPCFHGLHCCSVLAQFELF
jgi:hypothetical protein